MTSRRSTRASSARSSSPVPSVARSTTSLAQSRVSEVGGARQRRPRRQAPSLGNTTLPPIPAGTSTAYGSPFTGTPDRIRSTPSKNGPSVQQTIQSLIDNGLPNVGEEGQPPASYSESEEVEEDEEQEQEHEKQENSATPLEYSSAGFPPQRQDLSEGELYDEGGNEDRAPSRLLRDFSSGHLAQPAFASRGGVPGNRIVRPHIRRVPNPSENNPTDPPTDNYTNASHGGRDNSTIPAQPRLGGGGLNTPFTPHVANNNSRGNTSSITPGTAGTNSFINASGMANNAVFRRTQHSSLLTNQPPNNYPNHVPLVDRVHAFFDRNYWHDSPAVQTVWDFLRLCKRHPLRVLIVLWCLLSSYAVLIPSSSFGFHFYNAAHGENGILGDHSLLSLSSLSSSVRRLFPTGSNRTPTVDYYNEQDILGLQKRMSRVEYDITSILRSNTLNQDAIEYLRQQLPDYLVFKKDRKGEKVVPADFWLALRKRIKAEPVLDGSVWASISGNGDSVTTNEVAHIAKGVWSNFLAENELKIKALQGDAFDGLWTEHIKEAFRNSVLVSRDETIRLISEKFQLSQRDIKDEISKISKEFQRAMENIGRPNATRDVVSSGHGSGSLTKQDVRAISQDVVDKTMAKKYTQLDALTKIAMAKNVEQAKRRTNYFSPGNGALVDPILTSATFQYNKMQRGSRVWRWDFLRSGYRQPMPHRAVMALQRWDEPGDCWCAPNNKDPESQGNSNRNTDTRNGVNHGDTDALSLPGGMQLSVTTAKFIYPDQIVVEHIAATAALDPGVMPRYFEVWVLIEGHFDKWSKLDHMSQRMFSKHKPGNIEGNVVKIAEFEYLPSGEEVQAFGINLELKDYNVSTRKIIVRATDNYGAPETCFYRIRVHGDPVEVVTTP